MFLMKLLLRSFLCYRGPAKPHTTQDSALILSPQELTVQPLACYIPVSRKILTRIEEIGLF